MARKKKIKKKPVPKVRSSDIFLDFKEIDSDDFPTKVNENNPCVAIIDGKVYLGTFVDGTWSLADEIGNFFVRKSVDQAYVITKRKNKD
jgi:hypothetical protein